MSRSVALACLLALSCGGKSTPSTAVPEGALDPDPIDHPSVPSGFAIPEPLLGVPLYVKSVTGVPWFADEQLEAATIITQWARGVGFTVDDPVRTRQLFARAELGQDVATGQRCGAPLWSLPAAERWRLELHAHGRIEVGVVCAASCMLEVTVSEGVDSAADDAGRTAMWRVPFDRAKPWRNELAQRMWELTGAPTPPAVHAAASLEPLPASVIDKPRACLGDVGAVGLLLEVDAASMVARCESDARVIVGNGVVAACACKALRGARIDGGARRISTTVALPEMPASRSARGTLITASVVPSRITSERSVRMWEPPSPWTIAACFAGAQAPVQAKVTLSVSGARTKVADIVLTPLRGTLTPPQESCVTEALRRYAKIPCPDPGVHRLEAILDVRL